MDKTDREDIDIELAKLEKSVNEVTNMTKMNTERLIHGITIADPPEREMNTNLFKPVVQDLFFNFWVECKITVKSDRGEDDFMTDMMQANVPPQDIERILSEYRLARRKLGFTD